MRQADLGVGRRLRHPHHPDVLAGARRQRHGAARACRTRRRSQRPNSGNGYWDVTATRSSTRSVTRSSTATRAHMHLNAAAHRRRVASERQRLLAARRDGGIFTFGDAQFYGSTGGHAPQQAGERHGTHRRATAATGSSPTTAASSRSATRSSTARRAACTSTSRCSAWSAPRRGNGLLAVRARRRHLQLRRREVLRLARRRPARRRSSRCSARRPARATGCSTADGTIFAFGDAHDYGDIGGCTNYGGAAPAARDADRQGLLDRDRRTAASIAFGDAKQLGFPATVGGSPVGRCSVRRRDVAARSAYTRSTRRQHPWGARGNRAERVACARRRPPPTPRTCSG